LHRQLVRWPRSGASSWECAPPLNHDPEGRWRICVGVPALSITCSVHYLTTPGCTFPTVKPYLDTLDAWLREGELHDPYGEFLVCADPAVAIHR
jgi:hypothetical protein